MASPGDSNPGPDRPFRFLDLAAELRNNIYELTLTHDTEHEPPLHATPAFLRTCKQVYDEARDLLCARSTLHVTAKCTATSFSKSDLTVLRDGSDPILQKTRPNLLELHGAIPRHIVEIGTLELTIQLICGFQNIVDVSSCSFVPVNIFLYTLATRYRKGKLILTLDARCQIDWVDFASRDDLFYPIAKISRNVDLHLKGVDASTEKKVKSLRDNIEAGEVLQLDALEEWHSFVSKLDLPRLRPNHEPTLASLLKTVKGVQSSYQSLVESKTLPVCFEREESLKSSKEFLLRYYADDAIRPRTEKPLDRFGKGWNFDMLDEDRV